MSADRSSDAADRTDRLHQGAIATFVGSSAALLLLTAVGLLALQLDDAIVSFMKGESLWITAQKEAVIALEDYARTGDTTAWNQYREAMRVPLGDRRARLALQDSGDDLERAREGFLQGGLDPDEVDGMIRLFRWGSDWPPISRSIDIWTEADSLLAELNTEADRIRAQWQSPPPDTAVLNQTLARIEALNTELGDRSQAFRTAVDQAGDTVRGWSQVGIAVLSVLLLLAAGVLTRRMYRIIREREASLRRSEQRYRDLFENNVAGVFRATLDGELLECNRAFARTFGYESPEELEGVDVRRMYPSGVEREDYMRRLREEGRLVNEEVCLKHRDDSLVWILENSLLTEDPETGELVNEGTFVDITDRKEAEQERRLLSTAVETMGTGVLITGPNLTEPGPEIRYVNEAMTEMTGYREDELLGRTPRILQGPDTEREVLERLKDQLGSGKPFEGQTINYRKDGTPYHLRWQITPLRDEDGEISHFVSVQEDITDRKRLEEQLRHQALHDPLTGLANRTLLSDRVEHGLARCRRRGQSLGLLMLDVDHFKRINDRLGHTAGDQVLTSLARRFEEAVRGEDTVARWGGDEFVVVLPELTEPGAVEEVRERIRGAVRPPVQADGEAVQVDLTIGAVVYSHEPHPLAVQTESPEEMLRFASLALHWAKEESPGGYSLFDPAAEVEGVTQIRREGELRNAVKRGEIVPYYQPVVRFDDGAPVGVEALARWRHPQRGLVSPAEFIPLAEELGLIDDLQEVMIRQGCRQAARWARENDMEAPVEIAFNISGLQTRSPDLADELRGFVQEAGCRPEQVILEITETSLMQRPATVDALRAAGFRVYIDDFGTGYSTFTYLRELEVDGLKIDMTFVQGLTESDSDAALVETMVTLGERLGLDVIAEGVETDGQLRRLQTLGCRFGQGYLFGRPVSSDEIDASELDFRNDIS